MTTRGMAILSQVMAVFTRVKKRTPKALMTVKQTIISPATATPAHDSEPLPGAV